MAKININTATIDQLKSLPGIGPGLAKNIQEHIKKYGKFKKLSDLGSVKGISRELLQNIAKLVTVAPSNTGTKKASADKKTGPKVKFHGTLGGARRKIRFVSNSREPANIAFANTKLLGKKNVPLSSMTFKRLPTVHSDTTNFVDVKIPLSRFTPPGTHALDVLVDGTSHSVEIDVEEKVFVNLNPARFYIEAKPGSKVNKDLFVKNMGNFPVLFADPGAVILETDFIECRAIRHVARALDKDRASLDQVICLTAEKLEEIYDEGSTMKIRLNGAPKLIAPGKTEKFSLSISIPGTLKRPNRYDGMYRFYNSAISFTVMPTKN
ncbi:helix-hairpin-helix domain-containing protein [Spongiimicrobium sp. 2-473A-2-J]|uniref:helix-hairpin-helix domain-containing protein n=1 Tax=Eudoraea algarum TaxID=3417568 RepID=UPI003D363962